MEYLFKLYEQLTAPPGNQFDTMTENDLCRRDTKHHRGNYHLVNFAILVAAGTLAAPWASFAQIAITNPAPSSAQYFALSSAAVGRSSFIIGAHQSTAPTGVFASGAAYLFNLNGTLQMTFTNPIPSNADGFGRAVAALGPDRVVIGEPFDDTTNFSSVGTAYLFGTNGALLATFLNPLPGGGDRFGLSVATLGSDHIIVGAYSDRGVSSFGAGAAYLFDTNGTLQMTFTNPAPTDGDQFGWSVASLGTDRVLIGAPLDDPLGRHDAGAVYVYSTNGTLLTMITNVIPGSSTRFGFAVAGFGADAVLVGVPGDYAPGTGTVGAAQLYSASGALLTVITNPVPTTSPEFGHSVAVQGSDFLLIGAPYAPPAGAAYVFTRDGRWVATYTNPYPTFVNGEYGRSVAFVNEHVLVGAPNANDGPAPGAAYLYGLPRLRIARTPANAVVVSWPSPSPGYVLQHNITDVGTANWNNVPSTIHDDGLIKRAIIDPPTGRRFYRLRKP